MEEEEKVSVVGDTPDSGQDDSDIDVSVWLNRINKARDKEQKWRERAKRCIAIYRDDYENSTSYVNATDSGNLSFNILWANTETLLPALFSAVPKPDVRNRYLNQDKIADKAAEVIEKSLTYLMDKNKFERKMKAGVKDHILTGRLVTRVRLEPIFEEKNIQDIDESGNVVEISQKELSGHNANIENIAYDTFTVDPAKTWEEVTWIEFRYSLSRKKYRELFPGKPLPGLSKENDKYITDYQYMVHEVWDKEENRVFYITDGIEEPLRVMNDPLELEDFWPIPQPLYSIETSDTLVPIPEYTVYQQQANELDEISYRITDLVKSCKFIGIYDGTQTNLSGILSARDSQFVAVTASLLKETGLKGLIDVVDVSPIARVLQQLYVQRDQIKSIIYEITGISDIIRGDTVASETATAQEIKANYAGLRLRDRRANINRYIVDLLRLQAELMGRFFTDKQFEEMSGVKLDYSQEPLPPMPMPPMQDPYMAQVDPNYAMQFQSQMMEYQSAKESYQMEGEKREEAKAVLDLIRNDILCSYNIDIETDSTILANMDSEARKRAELVSSITQFIATTAPLVQSGAMPIETAKALLMFALQTTKIPRELEDAIELIGKNPQPMMGMPPMPSTPQPQSANNQVSQPQEMTSDPLMPQ